MVKITLIILGLAVGFRLCASVHEPFRRNEFRLGIGILPLLGRNDAFEVRESVLDLKDRNLRGDLYMAGNFFGSYAYQFTRWLQTGVSVSYTRYWRSKPGGQESETYATLIPSVRFLWLNREVVRLYSGFGIGVNWACEKDSSLSRKDYSVLPGGQCTFIGICVGKKLFGFSEWGIGNLGILSSGIGYRF